MKSIYKTILSHRKDDTPQGDLARDMIADKRLPENKNVYTLLSHLELRGACPEAIEAFFECVDEAFDDHDKQVEGFYLYTRKKYWTRDEEDNGSEYASR